MPLDRCFNFHNPTAGSWDSPSCPLIGQYWPLLWRHRSSKHAQLATPRSFLWYLCLFNSILLGRFVLRDKQLAAVNQYIWTFFDHFWPSCDVTGQKNQVNIIVSCRVRRDLSNAVWIFTLRLLLLKIRRGGGPLGLPLIRTRNSPDLIRARVYCWRLGLARLIRIGFPFLSRLPSLLSSHPRHRGTQRGKNTR